MGEEDVEDCRLISLLPILCGMIETDVTYKLEAE